MVEAEIADIAVLDVAIAAIAVEDDTTVLSADALLITAVSAVLLFATAAIAVWDDAIAVIAVEDDTTALSAVLLLITAAIAV